MPPDHNQQHSRRPHYHRGRRGPDRRGADRRPQPPQPEVQGRDQLDVEQIMREIRARIAERHGIDLTSQQIQELAARRLEAILDPRAIKPSLMDELRRAAGVSAEPAPTEPESREIVDEETLYQTDNGLLRTLRRLFNPLLKLLFNPAALAETLASHSRRLSAADEREAEQRRRQAEWNALHFEVLRRLVIDVSRVEIENQHLAQRVESLAARVDFNERRVRAFEAQHQARPAARPADAMTASPAAPSAKADLQSPEQVSTESSVDANRRRRRRRRGRRPGGVSRDLGGVAMSDVSSAAALEQGNDAGEFSEDLVGSEEPDDAGESGPPGHAAVDSGVSSSSDELARDGNPAAEPVAPPPRDAAVAEPTVEPTNTDRPVSPEHS